MNKNDQTIYKAIPILEEKTGLIGRWLADFPDKGMDGRLELKNGREKNVFSAIVKKDIKSTFLINLLQLKEQNPEFIIMAETIYPAIREQLRGMRLNYLDTSGNCYIKKNDWMFLVEGFKTEAPVNVNTDRAFTKAGLHLVFHFLNDTGYLNATYRKMAEDYGIALGTITNIINSLKDQGYVTRLNKNKLILTRKKELLDKWITAYGQKLKPSLLMGNFRFLNDEDKKWVKLPLKKTETQWGGEPAANLLTGYIKPVKLVLYTAENRVQLIRDYRLMPDEKGNLSIYHKFWQFNSATGTVPAMLVYADLVNSEDPRNIETAKQLYDGLFEDQF